MEVLINNLAKEYFHSLDVEDEPNLDFVSFEEDDAAASSSGTHSSATSGKIFYKKDEQPCQSECIFVKFRITNSQAYDIDVKLLFENEIHFYQNICPFLDSLRSIEHLVPKFLAFKRYSNADGDSIAIMLRRLGAEWVCHNYEGFMDYSHMSMMVRKLGEFHAYSFAAKQVDAIRFEKLANVSANMLGCVLPVYSAKMVATLQRGLQPLRLRSQYREAVARIDQILNDFPNRVTKCYSKQPEDEYYVLGHLSYIQSNVLFRYDSGSPVDMKIMDWQTASFLSLGVDLIITLYVDIGQQVRDMYWDKLLDDYHKALCSTFDNCDTPSRNDVVEELRRSVCAAFFMMAYRVLQMNRKTNLDGNCSHPIWNDELITEMFTDLIGRDLL